MIRVPVLCTREQVIGAIDFSTAYRVSQVDRAVAAATDNVHRLCNRLFYPKDDTRYFDWPNYQSTYPWKIYLDANELAAPATAIISGTNQPLSAQQNIPISAVNFEPINYGPPYSWIELRRDLSYTFGSNTTPQRDTSITGTYGYWVQTRTAGALAASVGSAGATQIQVTDGSPNSGVCVGDILLIGTERMIAADKFPLATSDTLTGAGCTTLSKTDNILAVASGASYAPGEQLLIDEEIMQINYIVGNNLYVNRAWASSNLATHTDGATIYAYRLITVLRGQLGTSAAASYNSATAVSAYLIPASVNELAVAEAETFILEETAGWARKTPTIDTMYQQETGGFGTRSISGKPSPLDALNSLRASVRRDYGRNARQRTS